MRRPSMIGDRTISGWSATEPRLNWISGSCVFLSDQDGERLITEKRLHNRDVWKNAWLAEMFCDWLLGDRADHPADLDDNIQCMALLFAAIESAHSGQVVDVQEYLRRHIGG